MDLHLPDWSRITLKDFGDLIHPVDGSYGPLAPVAHYDILVVLDLLQLLLPLELRLHHHR